MHIKENLINFLYDKEYYIAIYDKYIYCFNYEELISLKSEVIILKMPKFTLNIKGQDLFITKMQKSEILIRGIITSVGLSYE